MAPMQPTVATGLTGEGTFTITTEMTTAHTGTAVFSTPAMIQLMEDVSAGVVQDHLEANESSVGVHVCVSHVAGSLVGELVTVRSELRTIERDRFLTFAVSARVGERLLGEGTHQRAVIDLTRWRRPGT
jgi:fluoroacetyl-CoA thioesterase